MGILEITCIAVGLILGSSLYLRSNANESGVILGAGIGAFIGWGAAIFLRQISYRFFGYRKAKDDERR